MVLRPVLCPCCHSDRVITGGKTTAGQQHSTCQNTACPHYALPRDFLDTGRISALQEQRVAMRPNGIGLLVNRYACGLPV